MFGKSAAETEFRRWPRFSGRSVEGSVDGQQVKVLDYSDGGVRVALPESMHRRPVLVELTRGGKAIKKSVAVFAWATDTERGYEFKSNLNIVEVEDNHDRFAEYRSNRKADSLRPLQPLREKLKNAEPPAETPAVSSSTERSVHRKNRSGGVSGDALKNRLKF